MVQVFKQGTSETQRWVPFQKVYFCIMYYLKLVKKQGKIVGSYVLQLSKVDSNFWQILFFKALQKSYTSNWSDDQNIWGVGLGY